MARLNEPTASAESLEMLRRKFLRQNRDIARVNSTQSLRIRSLENECARLLSDNLNLRGQILRLEKAAENNPASRIADHALEVKAKMELQLLELGSLLDSLGLEPPMKRRSPNREERRMAKPRTSLGHSPRSKKMKDRSIEEHEALAAQEGRLPPIHEHKSYPRQTLNCQEILALCSEAEADVETSTDSPVLGPPPVSRYVEEDPEKVDSPNTARRILVFSDISVTEKNHLAVPKIDPPETTPVPSPSKKAPRAPEPQPAAPQSLQILSPPPAPTEPLVAKSGSKRKHAITDENEVPSFAANGTKISTSKPTMEKPASTTLRDIRNRRNAKGLPGARRDARDKKPTDAAPALARPALAAKSTNDDVASPRKLPAKGTAVEGDRSSNKAPALKEGRAKVVPPQIQVEAVPILPRSPSPPQVTVICSSDLVIQGSASQILSPGTPGRLTSREPSCDTPPPPDISSGGDTARPNRRSRAAVSYAEPNLRDKMRRPTKEMADAVSGEGKYKHRISSHETASAPRSAAKEIARSETPGSSVMYKASEQAMSEGTWRESGAMTPTSRKDPSSSVVQEVITMCIPNRQITMPSMDGKVCAQSKVEAVAEPTPRTARDNSSKARGNRKVASSPDPYEFTSASPAAQTITLVERSAAARSSQSKASRRQPPPVFVEGSDSTAGAAMKPVPRTNPSRKRASLAVAGRKTDHKDDVDDEYVAESEVDSSASQDRISRRRSMML